MYTLEVIEVYLDVRVQEFMLDRKKVPSVTLSGFGYPRYVPIDYQLEPGIPNFQ